MSPKNFETILLQNKLLKDLGTNDLMIWRDISRIVWNYDFVSIVS